MRFAVTNEHQKFFKKNHFIEFESIFPQGEIARFSQEIDRVLNENLNSFREKQVWDYFLAGHDIFRKSSLIKALTLSKKLAQIASTLSQKSFIRIAYDQVIKTPHAPILPKNYFDVPLSLKEISCFKEILCGLLLRLSPETDEHVPLCISDLDGIEMLVPLPQKMGSGIFFSPDILLDFSPLFKLPNQLFFLIVYCGEKTIYLLEENDPHTHFLKKLGYGFGDKLQHKTHPAIIQ